MRLDRVAVGAREVVTLVDVTPEWQSLTTIATSRSVRDRLMLDAEVGTWRYDPDKELYYFSSELSLGYDSISEPVPLERLQQIQHPADIEKDAAIRERLTTEGGSAVGEARYRKASGGWTTLRVHYRAGRKLASGKYEMFGISQNVSELADARDQADLVSGRLELAMAAANAGVYEIDMLTGKRWASDQYKELAGVAGARAPGDQSVRPLSRRRAGPRPRQLGALPAFAGGREHRHAPSSSRRGRALGSHLHARPAQLGRRADPRRRPDDRHRCAEAPGARAGRGQGAGRGGDARPSRTSSPR